MYRFRFESVLKYRRRIEDQKQREFAFIQRNLMTELSKLQMLEEARNESLGFLSERQKKGMSIREIALFDAYLERNSYDIDLQREDLYRLYQDAEIKRQELLEASQRKSILEKLREHERNDYLEEERRLERIRNDEISINKYARTMHYSRIVEADRHMELTPTEGKGHAKTE